MYLLGTIFSWASSILTCIGSQIYTGGRAIWTKNHVPVFSGLTAILCMYIQYVWPKCSLVNQSHIWDVRSTCYNPATLILFTLSFQERDNVSFSPSSSDSSLSMSLFLCLTLSHDGPPLKFLFSFDHISSMPLNSLCSSLWDTLPTDFTTDNIFLFTLDDQIHRNVKPFWIKLFFYQLTTLVHFNHQGMSYINSL